MLFCVALRRIIFSSDYKSLDPKGNIVIYASLSKNYNEAGCRMCSICYQLNVY